MIIALLAAMKVGATYIPLDPSYPKERLQWVLTDSRPAAVLTNARLQASVAALEDYPELIIIDDPGFDDSPETQQNPAVSGLSSTMIAYIIYTSGSTGRPKDVIVEQGSVINLLQCIGERLSISHEDRWLAVTTIAFDIAGLELYLPLITGACVVLCPRDIANDPMALAKLLSTNTITLMQATPTTWKLLFAVGWSPSPGLQILCGGEPLEHDLAMALITKRNRVWNLYGPTETTIWSTTEEIEADSDMICIGSPLWNTQVYILDPHGLPAPIGVEGEIYIGGVGVARGYLNRSDLTVDKFLPDPFAKLLNTTMYRTGDLAVRLPNGKIVYRGRNDDLVKIRGFRIELGEIQAHFIGHPEVHEAVVVARKDKSEFRRFMRTLHLSLKLSRRAETSAPILANYLPDYMIPAAYICMSAFPITPNGKLDRRALPFYSELLPEFKKRGRAVVAITHDDRYFHYADRVLQMQNGQLSEWVSA